MLLYFYLRLALIMFAYIYAVIESVEITKTATE